MKVDMNQECGFTSNFGIPKQLPGAKRSYLAKWCGSKVIPFSKHLCGATGGGIEPPNCFIRLANKLSLAIFFPF